MKKILIISIFIFWVLAAAVLTFGLGFNQVVTPPPGIVSNINNPPQNLGNNNLSGSQNFRNNSPTGNQTIILSANLVASHNSANNCWMIISGKIYDFTNYIPSHPGGSQMVPYCGKDATVSYESGPPHSHSSYAQSLLPDYYIGDLNSTISSPSSLVTPKTNNPASSSVNSIPAPRTRSGYRGYDD